MLIIYANILVKPINTIKLGACPIDKSVVQLF